MDHYELLGVTKDASTEEIHDAYRKAIAKSHPDINGAPEANSRTKELMQAYWTLSDPELRAAHDKPKLPPYRKKIDEPYYHLTDPISGSSSYSPHGGKISVSTAVFVVVVVVAAICFSVALVSFLMR